MNDQELDKLFDQNIPQADENAKKTAINAALSEFSQGSDQYARLIDNRDSWISKTLKSIGNYIMTPQKNTGTFASIAVAFIAVSIYFLMPDSQKNPNSTPINITEKSQHRLNDIEIREIDESLANQTPKTEILFDATEESALQEGYRLVPTSGTTIMADGKRDPFEPIDSSNKTDNTASPSSTSNVVHVQEGVAIAGARTTVQSSIDQKRISTEIVDDISPDHTGDIPTASINEALDTSRTQPQTLESRARTIQPISVVANKKAAPQIVVNSEANLPSIVLVDEEIVVTGTRATIQSSVDQKRITTEIVDGLSGNKIGGTLAASYVARPIALNDVSSPSPARLDDNEEHPEYETNSIKLVSDAPVSTFSIDVDTASYSLIRNQLNNGYLPKPQAVRAEELINYFDYDYPLPDSKNRPFKPTVSVLNSPWNKGKKLVHIGIKGYDISPSNVPDSNLVFLLDVSGSMNSANKLPLVKQSINLLLDTLKPSDTVSIVVYAGAAGVALEPTKVKDKATILSALNRLNAGGSTAGGQGIELAYQLADQNFKKGQVNRIILATDGDFNVGQSRNDDLKALVERKRDNGIFLSILGFGRNNYQDDMMQTLAQNGNGTAAYIDTLSEAKKVLVDEATSTLFTIAKDVKIQVEFNPNTVSEYRLIGYETRALKREDFNNDKVDAGDIGAGHTVTAVYEITPVGSENQSIDKPRYADNLKSVTADKNYNEYGFVKIRYKSPTGTKSKLIEQAIPAQLTKNENSEILFSTAVAGFAQLLTGGKYTGDLSYSDVVKLASEHKGQDDFGYRTEFIQLVRMAEIAKP